MTEMDDPNIYGIIVASDLHLGYREGDPVRADETFETFEEILQLATQRKADTVLLTGNIFHTATPSRLTMTRCIESLWRHCRMGARQLPVYAIHGSCDGPAGERLSALQLLSSRASGMIKLIGVRPVSDNLGSGTTLALSPVFIEKGTTKLALYGLDHMPETAFYGGFTVTSPPDNTWFNLLAVHQRRSRSLELALPSCMDVVLWGHEHACNGRHRGGADHVVAR